MDITQRFGKTVKTLREVRGLTQENLAYEADVHHTYISDIERGLKSPTLRTAQRISEVFDLPLDEMIKLALTIEE